MSHAQNQSILTIPSYQRQVLWHDWNAYTFFEKLTPGKSQSTSKTLDFIVRSETVDITFT